MDIKVTLKKAALGALTFATAWLSANPDVLTKLIPEKVATMTVGALVASIIVGATNWIKNRFLKVA